MRRSHLRHRLLAAAAPRALIIALAASPAIAGPEGGRVTGGAAAIVVEGRTTRVTQGSDRAIIEWDNFDIDVDETVRFEQPGRGSVALNRVRGEAPSEIAGQLQANGQVWIVNRHGIAFTETARVDVGGLLATTADIADGDFMTGRDRFTTPGEPGARVENAGSITFAEAGLAALVAPHAANSGLIAGEVGTVLVGGREAIAVDLAGDGLFAFEFDPATLVGPDGASVVMDGRIENIGGQVLISAAEAAALVDSAISVSGLVDTGGAAGGLVEIAAPGGAVELTGEVSARGMQGDGGSVAVRGGAVDVAETARIDASGFGAGGTALIIGTERLSFAGAVDVSGVSGDGGFIDTSAPRLRIESPASVVAASDEGENGLWLIDPVNIRIREGAPTQDGDVDAAAVRSALASGSDVLIDTAGAGFASVGGGDAQLPGADPGEPGTLTVVNGLSGAAAPDGTRLALNADAGVFIQSQIDDFGSPGFGLNIDILSRGGAGIVVDAPVLAGGFISMTAQRAAAGDAADITVNATVRSGVSGVSLAADGRIILGPGVDLQGRSLSLSAQEGLLGGAGVSLTSFDSSIVLPDGTIFEGAVGLSSDFGTVDAAGDITFEGSATVSAIAIQFNSGLTTFAAPESVTLSADQFVGIRAANIEPLDALSISIGSDFGGVYSLTDVGDVVLGPGIGAEDGFDPRGAASSPGEVLIAIAAAGGIRIGGLDTPVVEPLDLIATGDIVFTDAAAFSGGLTARTAGGILAESGAEIDLGVVDLEADFVDLSGGLTTLNAPGSSRFVGETVDLRVAGPTDFTDTTLEGGSVVLRTTDPDGVLISPAGEASGTIIRPENVAANELIIEVEQGSVFGDGFSAPELDFQIESAGSVAFGLDSGDLVLRSLIIDAVGPVSLSPGDFNRVVATNFISLTAFGDDVTLPGVTIASPSLDVSADLLGPLDEGVYEGVEFVTLFNQGGGLTLSQGAGGGPGGGDSTLDLGVFGATDIVLEQPNGLLFVTDLDVADVPRVRLVTGGGAIDFFFAAFDSLEAVTAGGAVTGRVDAETLAVDTTGDGVAGAVGVEGEFGTVSGAAGDFEIVNFTSVAIGPIAAESLSVTTFAGSITDVGALTIAGPASFSTEIDAETRFDVLLDEPGHSFGGGLSVVAEDVFIREETTTGALLLSVIDAVDGGEEIDLTIAPGADAIALQTDKNVTILAQRSISVDGDPFISIGGAALFEAVAPGDVRRDVLLNDDFSNFGGAVSITAEDAVLTGTAPDGRLALGAISTRDLDNDPLISSVAGPGVALATRDNLIVAADATITDDGAGEIVVGGAAAFLAFAESEGEAFEDFDILLDDVGHAFAGGVSAIGEDVFLRESLTAGAPLELNFVSARSLGIGGSDDATIATAGATDLTSPDALTVIAARGLSDETTAGDPRFGDDAIAVDGAARFEAIGLDEAPRDILFDNALAHVFEGSVSAVGEDIWIDASGGLSTALALGAISASDTDLDPLISASGTVGAGGVARVTAHNLTVLNDAAITDEGPGLISVGGASLFAASFTPPPPPGSDPAPEFFDVLLDDGHAFGGAVSVAAEDAWIENGAPSAALILGAIETHDTGGDATIATVAGDGVARVAEDNLTVIARSTITDDGTGGIAVEGSALFRAEASLDQVQRYADVLLDDGHAFGGTLSIDAEDAFVRDTLEGGGPLALGAIRTRLESGVFEDTTIAPGGADGLSTSRNFTIVSARGIADGVIPLDLDGDAAFEAVGPGDGPRDVLLDNEANRFGGAVSLTAEDALIAAASSFTPLALGAVSTTDADADPLISASGVVGAGGVARVSPFNLEVLNAGTITDVGEGTLSIAGSAAFVAEAEDSFASTPATIFFDVALEEGHVFGGPVSVSGEDVAISAVGPLALGAIETRIGTSESGEDPTLSGGDNLSVIASGAVTDTPGLAVLVAGEATLRARAPLDTTLAPTARFDLLLDNAGGGTHDFRGALGLEGARVVVNDGDGLVLKDVVVDLRARADAPEAVAVLRAGGPSGGGVGVIQREGTAVTVLRAAGVVAPQAWVEATATENSGDDFALYPVTLDQPGNVFGAVSALGSEVTVVDSGALLAFDSAATGLASFSAGGSLTLDVVRAGTLVAAGASVDAAEIDADNATLEARDGDIRLADFRVEDLNVDLTDSSIDSVADLGDGDREVAAGRGLARLELRGGRIEGAFDRSSIDSLVISNLTLADPNATIALTVNDLLVLDRVRSDAALDLLAGEIRLGHVVAPSIRAAATGDVAKLADSEIDFAQSAASVARVAIAAPPSLDDLSARRQRAATDTLVSPPGDFAFLVETPDADFTAGGDVLFPRALDGDTPLENDFGVVNASGGIVALEDANAITLGAIDADRLLVRANSAEGDGATAGVGQTGAEILVRGDVDIFTGRDAWSAAGRDELGPVLLAGPDNRLATEGGDVTVLARNLEIIGAGAGLALGDLRIAGDMTARARSLSVETSIVEGALDIAADAPTPPSASPGVETFGDGAARLRNALVGALTATAEGDLTLDALRAGSVAATAGDDIFLGTVEVSGALSATAGGAIRTLADGAARDPGLAETGATPAGDSVGALIAGVSGGDGDAADGRVGETLGGAADFDAFTRMVAVGGAVRFEAGVAGVRVAREMAAGGGLLNDLSAVSVVTPGDATLEGGPDRALVFTAPVAGPAFAVDVGGALTARSTFGRIAQAAVENGVDHGVRAATARFTTGAAADGAALDALSGVVDLANAAASGPAANRIGAVSAETGTATIRVDAAAMGGEVSFTGVRANGDARLEATGVGATLSAEEIETAGDLTLRAAAVALVDPAVGGVLDVAASEAVTVTGGSAGSGALATDGALTVAQTDFAGALTAHSGGDALLDGVMAGAAALRSTGAAATVAGGSLGATTLQAATQARAEGAAFAALDIVGAETSLSGVTVAGDLDAAALSGDLAIGAGAGVGGDALLSTPGSVTGGVDVGGDLVVGASPAADTPVRVAFDGLRVGGLATITARDAVAIEDFDVGRLIVDAGGSTLAEGEIGVTLLDGVARGPDASPTVRIDAGGGGAITIRSVILGDAETFASLEAAGGGATPGDAFLQLVGVSGDATIAAGDVTLDVVEVGGALTIDGRAVRASAASAGEPRDALFNPPDEAGDEVPSEPAIRAATLEVTASDEIELDDIAVDGLVTLRPAAPIAVLIRTRADLALSVDGAASPSGMALAARMPAEVGDENGATRYNLRLIGEIGSSSAPLRLVTIEGFGDVLVGLDPDGEGFLLVAESVTHALTADLVIFTDVVGQVATVRAPDADAAWAAADSWFGVEAREELRFSGQTPARVDLTGAIAGEGGRAAGLATEAAASEEILFNGCIVGDVVSCLGSSIVEREPILITNIETRPLAERAETIAQFEEFALVEEIEGETAVVPLSFRLPGVVEIDASALVDVYASFGNEELWALSPEYLEDLEEEQE